MEYVIEFADRSDLLENAVAERLVRGWSPSGGVSVCVLQGDARTDDHFVWAQAMTSTRESREAAAKARDY